MEHNTHSHGHEHHGHHLVPLKVYFLTIGALLVLTVVTVGASYLHFGSLGNVLVSLAIASAKATLVLMFFMGLKYDNNLNRAFILSSFAALMLLIGISASDLWTRPQPKPAVVKSTTPPLSEAEFNALLVSNADQVTKGKKLYDVNCATCHGPAGHGDGAGGASLNPKPRNFTAAPSSWTNGNSTKAMYVTLAHGVPGTGMASYKALPPADRIALIHYVHSIGAAPEATSKADGQFAAAMKEDGVGGEGAGAAKVALPIDFAIERVIKN
jgi:caa(3)-type oxidase subunit IV